MPAVLKRKQIVDRMVTIFSTLIPTASVELGRDRPFQFPDTAGIQWKLLLLLPPDDEEDVHQSPQESFWTMALEVRGLVQVDTPGQIDDELAALEVKVREGIATAEAERVAGLVQDLRQAAFDSETHKTGKRPGGWFSRTLRIRYWVPYGEAASVPGVPPGIPEPGVTTYVLHAQGAAAVGPAITLPVTPPNGFLELFLGGLRLTQRSAAPLGANEYTWDGTTGVVLWRAVGVSEDLIANVG